MRARRLSGSTERTFPDPEVAMSVSRLTRSSLPLGALFVIFGAAAAHAQGIESPRVPVRTAIQEINTMRAEYADLYNKKNVAALTAMYLPDAVVIRGDGSTLLGQPAISKALTEEAPTWKQISLTSDTMRVFGNTAWDIGTLTSRSSDGDPSVSHYLVVLRRGVETWRVSSLAVVAQPRMTTTR
jgi:ketosteroid isomerase-like protein